MNDIFGYFSLTYSSNGLIIIHHILLKKDYGPWQQGNKIDTLEINLMDGTMKELKFVNREDQAYELIRELKFEFKIL